VYRRAVTSRSVLPPGRGRARAVAAPSAAAVGRSTPAGRGGGRHGVVVGRGARPQHGAGVPLVRHAKLSRRSVVKCPPSCQLAACRRRASPSRRSRCLATQSSFPLFPLSVPASSRGRSESTLGAAATAATAPVQLLSFMNFHEYSTFLPRICDPHTLSPAPPQFFLLYRYLTFQP